MSVLSEPELLDRLVQSEDPWVERKQSFNEHEVRRTIVAFANTVPEDQVAVLFLGAHNRGEHKGLADADDAQKKVDGALGRCYPPISYQPKVLVVDVAGTSKEILAIMVPFSTNRPHFSGPAYIRRGSETIEASPEVFRDLIASQNDKARRILGFKAKPVRLRVRCESGFWHEMDATVDSCDAHSVTLRDGISVFRSFPLARVEIETTLLHPLKIVATTDVSEREHLREMMLCWAPMDLPPELDRIPTEVFGDAISRQFLDAPEKALPVVAAVAEGRSNVRLRMLLGELQRAHRRGKGT